MSQSSETASRPLTFERLAEIAVGATARIELCRVTEGPRRGGLVVVKRLHPHIADDPQFVNMFRDEAWMTASLKNEHVVQVVGWGTDDEGPFLAVDFVRGVSLARLMKTVFETGERFTERLVVYIGACVCDGLAAAHSLRSPSGEHLNLVHRDITPGNVLLGFDGHVKIADFGLAKAKMRLTKTLTGLLKGQPHYMAPEQIRSQPLDGRTDVFALGVVLYELFSGRRPWNAASDLEAMRATVEDRPQPLARYRPKIDKALVKVVEKCLEKDPAARYQYAGVLRDEFGKWLGAHGYRDDNDIALARFVRRNAMRQMRWFDRAIAGHFAKRPQPTPFEVDTVAATPQGRVRPGAEVEGLGATATTQGSSVPEAVAEGDDLGDEGPTLIQKEQENKAKRILRRISDGLRKGRDASDDVSDPVPTSPTRQATVDAAAHADNAAVSRLAQALQVRDEPSAPEATTVRRHGRRPAGTAPAVASQPPAPHGAPTSAAAVSPSRSSVPPGVVAPPDPAAPPVPTDSASSAPNVLADLLAQSGATGADLAGEITREAERLSRQAAAAAETARLAAAAADAAARAAALAGEAVVLATAGQSQEALERIDQARRLDPTAGGDASEFSRRGVWPRSSAASDWLASPKLQRWKAALIALLSKEGVALFGVLLLGILLVILFWALMH